MNDYPELPRFEVPPQRISHIASRNVGGPSVNFITLAGAVESDPAPLDTTYGPACEFRLAIPGPAGLIVVIQATGELAVECLKLLRRGRRVVLHGQLVHESRATRAGHTVDRWFVRASTIGNKNWTGERDV